MHRLWAVPHFFSGMVERAKRERAWKSPHARKGVFLSPPRVSPFLAWGGFHARSRFARSTIPEEKSGTTRSLPYASLNSLYFLSHELFKMTTPYGMIFLGYLSEMYLIEGSRHELCCLSNVVSKFTTLGLFFFLSSLKEVNFGNLELICTSSLAEAE